MRRIFLILAAVAFVFGFTATSAVADWKEEDGHKMHFPQLPHEAGWDVNATQPLVLADDWMCSETGPVTDIHFWGSWMHGIDGVITSFVLSIHKDIPAGPQNPYSKPGDTLWEETITDFVAVPIDPGCLEGWYDPYTGEYLVDNHPTYFQYNVRLPKEKWFEQEEGTIYWLNISATIEGVDPPQPVWGWKSTLNHWNDDAVWAEGVELNWVDMYEPPDFSQSLDLSFVITGGLDYGDAPDPTYPTFLASNGARHAILSGFYLGAGVDTEPDGQPDPNALGDDTYDGNDDEDGIVFTSPLVPGQSANVDVTASAPGYLDAWVDFNDDGDWADAGEQIFTIKALLAGVNSLSFAVPASATVTSQTFARFRFSSSQAGLSYTGAFEDGEVEDYEVAISQPPVRALAPIYLLLLDEGAPL